MKRFFSFLLIALLCISFCPVFASAAGEDLIASIKGGTAQIGGTITVPVSLDVNKGFVTLGIEVSYDSKVLEIVCENHKEGGKSCSPSVEKTKFTSGNQGFNSQYHTNNPYRFQWAFGTIKEDICTTGQIASITFKVKDTAKLGTTKVSVKIDQASCYSKKRRTFSGGEATIKIVCANHISGASSITKQPTCTEKGVKTYLCTVCKGVAKTEEIPAVGHTFGKWTLTKAPTCAEVGIETRICTKDAKHKETREIKAIDHSFGEWSQTKKPTCTEEGEETRVCKIDAKHKETRKLPKAQEAVSWEIIKEPTLTSEGERRGKCAECGKSITETIPKLGSTNNDDKTKTDNPANTDKENQSGSNNENNTESVLESEQNIFSSEEQSIEQEKTSTKKNINITILVIVGGAFFASAFTMIFISMKKHL